jgi:hypothetical protein
MISRHYDVDELMETMGPYEHELKGFYPDEWISNEQNVCLTDGNGNFTLFQRFSPEVVMGHYFLQARGREALKLCETFLEEIFTGPYDVSIIQGITPHTKLGALWMNKKLGFKSGGTVNTIAGPCELVVLSKLDWERRCRDMERTKANGRSVR